MIREHDQIVLLHDIFEKGLKKDDIGTVVHVYPEEKAYEVEFTTLGGQSIAVTTLKASEIRETGSRDIPHARILAAK